MTDLSEMRRIAEAATPGPWGQDDYENWRVGAEGWWVAYCGPEPPDPNPLKSERDAAYIATFDPPTVLALLDVVEAASNLVWEPGNVLVDQQAVALSRALSRLESL